MQVTPFYRFVFYLCKCLFFVDFRVSLLFLRLLLGVLPLLVGLFIYIFFASFVFIFVSSHMTFFPKTVKLLHWWPPS